jgi:serine/threonine-protein kinase
MLAEAALVGGRYRLDEPIGEGGMGTVWRATDLTLARPVALKLLYTPGERERERMQRQFLREARLAAAVQHPNVVQITDFGTTEMGNPFIVMELLRGETLAEKLRREGVLRADDVLKLARRVLDGLHAVHSAAVVHRDLKPENIFLVEDRDAPYPKILDFGISRSVDPESGRSSHTTREGILMGTPEYMSPEQVRGLRDIDTKSDLYSLGVIMYEALTGECPYASENRGDLIIMIAAGGAPPARMKNAAVRRGLSDVIERAMATDRERRFADAAQMQAALDMAEADPDAPISSILPLEAPQREAAVATRRDTARIEHPTLIADPPAFSIDTRMRIGAPIAIAAMLLFAGSVVGSTIWISHELTSAPETRPEPRPSPAGPPTRARAQEPTMDPEPVEPAMNERESAAPVEPVQEPVPPPPDEVEAGADVAPVVESPGMRNPAMRTAMTVTETPEVVPEDGDPPRTLRELDY